MNKKFGEIQVNYLEIVKSYDIMHNDTNITTLYATSINVKRACYGGVESVKLIYQIISHLYETLM